MSFNFKYDTKNYKVLAKVPEYPLNVEETSGPLAAIIDLETTGLDYKKDKITEIGIIVFSYDADPSDREFMVRDVISTYAAFNDPGIPITDKITKLTGITDEMVKGQSIDWSYVQDNILSNVDIIICHHAAFDRKFLEAADCIFEVHPFGCTKNDIDWQLRDYGNTKLDYLNFKMGYFYDGHRALNDCWAALNLLVQEPYAMHELLENCRDEYQVYALNAPYAVKDTLRENGFYWNDGTNGKPKAWYKQVYDTDEAVKFLQDNSLASPKIIKIPANRRYSSIGE